MFAIFYALLLGGVAGLRTATAPAAVSWAASLGWLNLQDSWLAFMAHPVAPWILTAMAIAELVTDQLPSRPSRKEPAPFIARLVSGALCGAAIGISGGALLLGIAAGGVGAIMGTLGGHAVRARIATALGKDRPAALIEDVVAIAGALLIVWAA